jgi:RNA polymerase-binding protein DksA
MNPLETIAKETLLARRRALSRLFEDNRAEEKRLAENVDPDWPDRAASHETALVLERLTEGERRELLDINAALERIVKGAYGTCEECHRAIGRQRLRALPEARRCITCSEQKAHSP